MVKDDENKMLVPLKKAYNTYVKWLQQWRLRLPHDKDWQDKAAYMLKIMGGIAFTLEQLGYNMTDDEMANGFVIEQ